MKKIYLSASLCLAGVNFVNAQISDTLVEHFIGATPNFYTWGPVNGYIGGTNSYGDEAIIQLFDNAYGVLGVGTIEGVLLWVGYKSDAGGSYDVNIWADDAGEPGSILGSVTIDLAATDTSAAGVIVLDGGTAFYNVNAAFATAVDIPTDGAFWAGFVIPTTAAAGDTVAILTSTDGDFADPGTHSGVINGGSFLSYADAGPIAVANAIFPYVTFTSITGVSETDFEMTVFPNPVSGNLNFQFSTGEASLMQIKDFTGRLVTELPVNSALKVSADLSSLATGTYAVEVLNSDASTLVRTTFVKE